MAHGLRFCVLGPVAAVRDGAAADLGQPLQRAVLVALLLRDGAPVSAEQLIDDVWGEAIPRSAVASLRNYVYRLRQSLGDGRPGLIRSVGSGYSLAVGAEAIDLNEFSDHLAHARELRGTGDAAGAEKSYAVGLQLWSGPPLAEVPGPFAHGQRGRLAELRLAAVQEHLACVVELGRGAEAAAELSALAAAHPLRERILELQMLALYDSGRRAEALAVYTRARRLLRDELGVDPGPGLRRTHQLILTDDRSLAQAPAAAGPSAHGTTARFTPAQLPAALPRFTGRQDEIKHIVCLAPAEGRAAASAALCVIHGMGGMGKTTLAVHCAHLLAEHYPDGQLYVNLRGFDPDGSALDPSAVLAEFLDSLGVPASVTPASPTARSALFRSVLSRRRVLVLLDNARDAEQVRPLLPGAPGCLTLVTSRNPMPGLAAGHQAQAVPLDRFDAAGSREYLASRLGQARLDADPDAVAEIVEYCGGLPLALAIVTAHVSRVWDFPLREAARELGAARGGLDAFALGADPAVNARIVFSWSYQALSPAAAQLFRMLAAHPGPDFTGHAAAALTAQPVDRVDPLLHELCSTNLVYEHAYGRYAWHDLLRAYATELIRTEEAEVRDEALRRLLGHYTLTARAASHQISPRRTRIPTPPTPEGVSVRALPDARAASAWFSTEYRVVLALIRAAADNRLDDYLDCLAWSVDNFLNDADLSRESLALRRIVYEAALRCGNPFAEARAARALANSEVLFGFLDQAQARLEAALERLVKLGDSKALGNTHTALAFVFHEQKAYDRAILHTRRALAMARAEKDLWGQPICLDNLGLCHAQTGHGHQAVVAARVSLRLSERLGAQDQTPGALDVLGFGLQRLGRVDEAIAAYEHCVSAFPDYAQRRNSVSMLSRLGDLYLFKRDLDAARGIWTRALELTADGEARFAEIVAKLSTLG